MAANPLLRLRELGRSAWVDYIQRDLIVNGELARLIREDGGNRGDQANVVRHALSPLRAGSRGCVVTRLL